MKGFSFNLFVSKSDGRSMTRRIAKEHPTTIMSLTRTLIIKMMIYKMMMINTMIIKMMMMINDEDDDEVQGFVMTSMKRTSITTLIAFL